MFDRIKKLLGGAGWDEPSDDPEQDTQAAVAALLVEAGRMDQDFSSDERRVVEDLLAQRFELSKEQVSELIEAADERTSQSAQYFPFTHRINQAMGAQEKTDVIEMLWSVAYADGTLDPYEDQLIRQIAGLIYVTDRDRMLARKRALAKIAGTDEES